MQGRNSPTTKSRSLQRPPLPLLPSSQSLFLSNHPCQPCPPNPQQLASTAHHLKQYINRMVLQNCSLKQQLDNQNSLVQLLQNSILEKDAELNEVNDSKQEVVQSVQIVTETNKSYIQALKVKNQEIRQLRSQLERRREQLTGYNTPGRRDSTRQDRIRASGKKLSSSSTQAGSVAFDQIKRFVENTQARLNIRRQSVRKW